VAPTVAARKLATVDQFSGGRLAVHIISGGSDADQRRDGDYLDHDARYRRTDEYLQILRSTWTASEPGDHAGEFYRYEGAWSAVRCQQLPHLPIYFGGSSDVAVEVAARHADVYAMWGEPLDAARLHIERVRAAAAAHGRSLRISLSLRPILGATEDRAWQRAYEILELTQGSVGAGAFNRRGPGSVGSQRLLDAAAAGAVHDQRLFTAIAAATGAAGNSTALVGTPDQVAESMLAYIDIGVTTLLIRGFDPYDDAAAYAEVIRRVRAEVARRDARQKELTPTAE
jgi:alkanesulfonate monooxygenase